MTFDWDAPFDDLEAPLEPADPFEPEKLREPLKPLDCEEGFELRLLLELPPLFLALSADLPNDLLALLLRLLCELREPPLVPDAFAVFVIVSPLGRFPVGSGNHFPYIPRLRSRTKNIVNARVNQSQYASPESV